MGIEENIERIANALERIASAQEKNTEINEWYKGHLMQKGYETVDQRGFNAEEGKEVLDRLDQEAMNAAATAQGVASAPASVTLAPSGPVITQEMVEAAAYVAAHPTALTALGRDLTFDELKVELLARAHAYKKGTKATTLQKEWDLHKHEPIIGAKPTPITLAEPQTDVNPAGYAPSLTEASVSAPVQDPFGTDDTPNKAPMTREEAFERIKQNYHPTEKDDTDIKIMCQALASVGVQSFKDVPEGRFEVVVAEYERLKGLANA